MSAVERDTIPDDRHVRDELDRLGPVEDDGEDAWGLGREGLLWITLACLQVTWLVLLGRLVVDVV